MSSTSEPKWYLALLGVGLVVLVSMALLEMGLRAYESYVLKIPAIPSAKGAIHQHSSHPGRVYELTPNTLMLREGVEIRTNSMGFRDDEPSASAAGKRIMVLGDSVAWGFGVRADEAFPQRLEQAMRQEALRRGAPEPVVFNTAVDGYSLVQQVATLEALGPSLKPDLIIVAYVLNDPSSAQDGGLDRYFRSEFFIQRYGRIAIERIRELSYGGGLQVDYFQRAHQLQSEAVRKDLARLATLARELDAQVILAVCPVFEFESGGKYVWSNIHGDLEVLAAEQEFTFIDLQPAFSGVASKDVAVDILHPNVLGHRIIADVLIKETSRMLDVESASR